MVVEATTAAMMAAAIVIAVYSYSYLLKMKKIPPEQPADRQQQKKKNDNLVTRIHGKWYNLSDFDHPGGPVALSLIERRDGTALFESHHPLTSHKKLMKILSKYEVPQAKESAYGCQLLDERDDGLVYE